MESNAGFLSLFAGMIAGVIVKIAFVVIIDVIVKDKVVQIALNIQPALSRRMPSGAGKAGRIFSVIQKLQWQPLLSNTLSYAAPGKGGYHLFYAQGIKMMHGKFRRNPTQ